MNLFLQVLINGIALGSVYALVALGFVLIFKGTRVLNFAQGDILMLGAFLFLTFYVFLEWPLWVAAALAVLLTAGFGLLIERGLMRPLVGESILSMVMVTIALSTTLRGLIIIAWGAETFDLPLPLQGVVRFAGINVSRVNLTSLIVCGVLLAVFLSFFYFSKLGLAMRATALDQETSLLMGISLRRTFALTWAIAGGVAAIGGIFLGAISFVDYHMSTFGLRTIPAVILGGMDSVPGAILGGVLVGVAETVGGLYLRDVWGGSGVEDVVVYGLLLLTLMIRPYGFFGTREIERV